MSEALKGSTKTLKIVDYVIAEIRLQKINTYNPSEIISVPSDSNFEVLLLTAVWFFLS